MRAAATPTDLACGAARGAACEAACKAACEAACKAACEAACKALRQKAKTLGLDADFDGELQLDAALAEEVASRKLPHSRVAGKANVLIFPDLNSGNIAYKLLQHVARANAYGQILLGLGGNAADVSRGSNAHDILGVATIVGIQSIADRAAGDEDAEDMDTDTGMF